MTPQKKSMRQSPVSRRSAGRRSQRTGRSRRTKVERSGSRVFLECISRQIPVYPSSLFLLPLESVESLLRGASAFRVELKTGEDAYQQSTDTSPLILVERGLIELSLARKGFATARRVEPGFVFGEAPMLEMSTFGARAIAAEYSTIFLIDPKAVEEIVWSTPELSRRWIGILSRSSSMARRDIRMLVFGSLQARVAALLLDIAEGGKVLNITQAEMGRMLGAHRESVSLALSALKHERLVGVKRREIEILNRKKLEEMVTSFSRVG